MRDMDGAETNIQNNESGLMLKTYNTVQSVSSSKGETLSVHLAARMGEHECKRRTPTELSLFFRNWKYCIRITIKDPNKPSKLLSCCQICLV